jgi:CelD/BcsL family acetyltransferase involved in cellulose biosynthesis
MRAVLSTDLPIYTPACPRPQWSRQVITEVEQLSRLAPAWQELLGRSTANEPVLSPAWMLTWWRIFGDQAGRQLCVLALREDDRLVGLAPLLRRRWWYRPGLPFWRLELLGTGETEEDAVYPEYLHLLAERGREAEVAAGLAQALVSDWMPDWHELVIPRLAGDSPFLPFLVEALRGVGLSCRQVVSGVASYIPLPDSWEKYLAQLPGSHRYYVRQSLRRFERWAGNRFRLHEVRELADLAEGQRVLISLHQERWGVQRGKFASARFAAFHAALLPAFWAAGAAELLWLTVDDLPIAALYNFLWNGKVYFYQSGRRLDLPPGIRPGIVLHALAIQRAIATGRREYDFLEGGEAYKERLALAIRPLVDLRVVRPCWRERLRSTLSWGRSWARHLRDRWRAFRGRRPPIPSRTGQTEEHAEESE